MILFEKYFACDLYLSLNGYIYIYIGKQIIYNQKSINDNYE